MVRMYVKRPIPIAAVQWVGNNLSEVLAFCPQARRSGKSLIIPTLEGDHIASLNDYVIKGIKGECYPCKRDIFSETYKEVD